MSDKQYDNTNRGVLFRNEDKRDERDPVYRGNINIDGKEFWLDAWLQEAKKSGKTFMSLRVKPKMAREVQGGSANPPARTAVGKDDFDSDIPF